MMIPEPETIKWKEPLGLRRRAYQGAYARHLIGEAATWVFWCMLIAAINTWRMGNALWSYRGATTIALAGLLGFIIRLVMEFESRRVWLSQRSFRIHHIIFYSCPVEAFSKIGFISLGDDTFSMQFEARSRLGRRRKFVIGLDRTIASRAMELLSLGETAKTALEESLSIVNAGSPRKERQVSNVIYLAYIRGIAWLCIAAGITAGVRALIAGRLNIAIASGAIAVVFLGVGISVVHEGFLVRWYRQILTRARKKVGDSNRDRKS